MLDPSKKWEYKDIYSSVACSEKYCTENSLLHAQQLIVECLNGHEDDAKSLFIDGEFQRPFLVMNLANRIQYLIEKDCLQQTMPYLMNELGLRLIKDYNYDLSLFKPPEVLLQMDIEDIERYIEKSNTDEEREAWVKKKKTILEDWNLSNEEYLRKYILFKIKFDAGETI